MEAQFNLEKNQRVVTFLNRDEVDFLDKVGKDALFTTGVKLSRAKLIAWLVDFLKDLRIDGSGIQSEDDFAKKIKTVMTPPATVPHPDAEDAARDASASRRGENNKRGER